MYYVYEIKIQHLTYFGHTKSLTNRLSQHIAACYNVNSKAFNKVFYKEVRLVHPTKESGSEALKTGFRELFKFKTKANAKRREFKLIIDVYFSDGILYQKIPNISDM